MKNESKMFSYRGYECTKEHKESFQNYFGIKLKRVIDRFWDDRVNKMHFETFNSITTIEIFNVTDKIIQIKSGKTKV